MEQFFADTWPEIVAALAVLVTAAKLAVTKFPQAARYLKYVAAVADVIIFAGRAIKNAKAKNNKAK